MRSAQLEGELLEPISGHHVVDHAQAVALLRREGGAGEEELLGLACAQLPDVSEELVAVDAEGDDRVGERGVVARHHQVERPHQHEAAGDHLALHLDDGRLGQVAPAPAQAEVDLLLGCHVAFGRAEVAAAPEGHGLEVADLGLVAQVVTRGEVRAVGGDHDHLDLVVERGGAQRGIELVEHALVLGVACFGAREGDAGDARQGAVGSDAGGFGWHGCLLSIGWRRCKKLLVALLPRPVDFRQLGRPVLDDLEAVGTVFGDESLAQKAAVGEYFVLAHLGEEQLARSAEPNLGLRVEVDLHQLPRARLDVVQLRAVGAPLRPLATVSRRLPTTLGARKRGDENLVGRVVGVCEEPAVGRQCGWKARVSWRTGLGVAPSRVRSRDQISRFSRPPLCIGGVGAVENVRPSWERSVLVSPRPSSRVSAWPAPSAARRTSAVSPAPVRRVLYTVRPSGDQWG